MKVLLISANISESPYPLYPLGMSVIAKALTDKGHCVKQLDYLQKEKDFNLILSEINNIKPEIIGISIRNIDNTNFINKKNYINSSVDFIREIKKNTDIPIILGGSGFSLFPKEILEKSGADYGVQGEGETVICEFISNFSEGIIPERKILTNNNQQNQMSPALYSDSIMNHYLKFGKTAPLQTKRGCCNNCIYCTYPYLEGNKIRCRDPKEVVNDIIHLQNTHKSKMIFFTDSVFNDKDENFIYVLEEMKKQNVKVPWTAFFQPSFFNDSTLSLMKETGLEYIELGADATTDTTLKKMGKKFSFGDIRNTVDILMKKNIYSSIYYMFGVPGETEETVFEGIKNIKSIKNAVSLIFMGIRILPGTPLEKISLKEKIIEQECDLFEEKYYISSMVNKEWLDQTLRNAFKKNRICIYPPDSLDKKLQLLHSIGSVGMGVDKLIPTP
jgi:lipid biosynthesis B12-binding/radical SAM protein